MMRPCGAMRSSSRLASRKWARWLMAKVSSKPFGDRRRRPLTMPALLISSVIGAESDYAPRAQARTLANEARSQAIALMLGAWHGRGDLGPHGRCGSQGCGTAWRPVACARQLPAVTRPIPCVVPVTTATCGSTARQAVGQCCGCLDAAAASGARGTRPGGLRTQRARVPARAQCAAHGRPADRSSSARRAARARSSSKAPVSPSSMTSIGPVTG